MLLIDLLTIFEGKVLPTHPHLYIHMVTCVCNYMDMEDNIAEAKIKSRIEFEDLTKNMCKVFHFDKYLTLICENIKYILSIK